MSLASENRARALELRVTALEAAISRLGDIAHAKCAPVSDEDPRLRKIENDIQGLKMRMGKVKE